MLGMTTPDLTALAATAAKLDAMIEADGPLYRYTANALEQVAGAVGDVLRGTGADEVTITVLIGGAPVPDADVWITSDAAGDVVVAGTLQTDSGGHAAFLLDAGSTYFLWVQKDSINSISGESFVAIAD